MELSKMFSWAIVLLVSVLNVNAQNNPLDESYLKIADDFKKNQQPDSALMYYKMAAAEFKSSGNTEQFVNAFNQAGVVLTRQDKYELAKRYLDKALETGLASLDTNNLTLATTYLCLGVVYNAEGNYERSLESHFKALSIRLRQLGENDAQVATSYGNIGNVYLNAKDYDKSIEAHLKAMKIREKLFGETGVEVIQSYTNLGNAYKEKKEYNTALSYYEKALKNKILQRGEDHKELSRYYKNISEVYFLMGNKEQGEVYLKKSES